MRPSIDHSILSPSGRVSKRARRDAIKRARKELFPDGFWDPPEGEKERTERAGRIAQLERKVQDYQHFIKQGFRPRVHKRELVKVLKELKELKACPTLGKAAKERSK